MLLQTAVQEFSHQERFSALQALLDGRLLECQRRAHIIRGVFAGEPKLSCQVSLNDQGKVSGRCDCGQPRCLHQAALVIELAAHSALEEQGRSRRSDTAIRLFRSDLKERFDPFPTMARHRILYLLAPSETGLQLKVLKGYLNKNGRYQLKGPLGFELLQSQPVPKYVSQTDLKLLHLLREVAGQENGETFRSETSPETSSENLRVDSIQSQLPEYLSPAVSRLDALAEQQQESQAGASLEQAILIDLKCSLANDAFGSQPLSSEHSATLDSDFYRLLFASGRCFFGKVAGEPVRLATHYDEDYLDEELMLPLCAGVWLDTCSGTGILDKRQDQRINQQLLEGVDLDGDWLPRLEIARESLEQHWHEPMLSPIDVAKFSMVHRGRRYDFEALSYLGAGHKAFMAQFAKCQLMLNPLPLLTSQFEPAVTETLNYGLRLVPGEVSEHVILLRTLSLKGWQIELVAKQRFVQVAANAWYGEVNSADKDWFELSLGVEVEGKRVNLLPLLVNLIRQGKLSRDFTTSPYLNTSPHISTSLALNTNAAQSDKQGSEQLQEVALELESGAILTLPASRVQRILAVLDELFTQQPLNDQEKLVLARHHLGRIPLLDDALSQSKEALTWSGEAKLRQHAKALGRYLNESQTRRGDRLGTADFVAPNGLNAELRPYQVEGVAWLQFIKQHGFGAILADDMGLGKTLQTLCSILLDKQAGVCKAPVLVVAPTSLLSNWQREIAQFTPSLTSFIWSGRARHDNEQALTHVDVLITSYGILAQDAERLTKLSWHQVILDEAQTIKNSRSRITKLVNRLQTKHRLCLTGTPMENHLGELWSLFHFLMPGFLGTATQFQRQFKQPIEKDHCDTSRQRLAQRLAPFMLRRTKRQVATELPTKTVINTLIELSQSQSDLYETIRLTVAEQVQLALRQTGAKANRLMISNALLKLRQVCCHPSMLNLAQAGERVDLAEASSGAETSRMNAAYDGGQDEANVESSKLAWLENKLPNMIEDGRNILIFSSFTSMLDLIAEQLDRQQIGYEMLTGRSRHRDRIIERFRRGEVNVFLISLKAGGSGLNLTEADVVIHVDPWWNPAAEEQASDRAYRIGQDKPVFVYKLICQNTVEERIQQLQQSKQALAQSMYQTESLTAAEMDKDDWLALLQPITEQPIAD